MLNAAGKLTIDLGALSHNYDMIRQKLGDFCRAGAVLKANAYGLGATQISSELYAAGCRDFFVAKPEEGMALEHLPRDASIYILNGFYSEHAALYKERGLIPVIGSFMEIEEYKLLAATADEQLPAWLKFNIRMNRLGLGSVETRELLANMSMLDGLNIRGVMGHFACADEPDNPMTETQYEIFSEIADHFPRAQKSLTNSSGIFRDEKYHFDLARPGMALYGLNPIPETDNPMKRVVSLDLPVIRCRIVYAGARTGYGATYRFEKDTPLATVSAGYADGIFYALGNKGALYWKGYRLPIRGRVSMDLTTVDLSEVPEDERPKPNDFLELIGPYQGADDLAAAAGTIGYEVLTALGTRYKRSYVNGTGFLESVAQGSA